MIEQIKQAFRRASRQRLTLEACLVKGDKVIETETIDISDTGVLLKNPNANTEIFMAGEYMQLHIEGYVRTSAPQTSVFPVVLIRSEKNTLALEFI